MTASVASTAALNFPDLTAVFAKGDADASASPFDAMLTALTQISAADVNDAGADAESLLPVSNPEQATAPSLSNPWPFGFEGAANFTDAGVAQTAPDGIAPQTPPLQAWDLLSAAYTGASTDTAPQPPMPPASAPNVNASFQANAKDVEPKDPAGGDKANTAEASGQNATPQEAKDENSVAVDVLTALSDPQIATPSQADTTTAPPAAPRPETPLHTRPNHARGPQTDDNAQADAASTASNTDGSTVPVPVPPPQAAPIQLFAFGANQNDATPGAIAFDSPAAPPSGAATPSIAPPAGNADTKSDATQTDGTNAPKVPGGFPALSLSNQIESALNVPPMRVAAPKPADGNAAANSDPAKAPPEKSGETSSASHPTVPDQAAATAGQPADKTAKDDTASTPQSAPHAPQIAHDSPAAQPPTHGVQQIATTQTNVVPTDISLTNAPQSADAPVPLTLRTVAGLPDAAESMDALAVRIAAKSADGDSNFQIRLDPPELGRIDVSLKLDSQGNAHASLSADRQQTLDLLQRDAPALERALKDAGLALQGGLSFSLKGDGRSGAWRDAQGAGRNRNLQIASIDAAGASTASLASSLQAYGGANTRLDIRV